VSRKTKPRVNRGLAFVIALGLLIAWQTRDKWLPIAIVVVVVVAVLCFRSSKPDRDRYATASPDDPEYWSDYQEHWSDEPPDDPDVEPDELLGAWDDDPDYPPEAPDEK
jgi:hypothetical protein